MFSVSDNYLQAIVGDTRDMPYRVKLAGAIPLSQTQVPKMSLSESVSGSSGISVGTSNSATLTLTLRDADAIDYTDILVEPESGLTLPDGTIEWVPLGKFWVTKFSTSNDYKTVNLTCADGMYLLSGEYISKLTYPSTVEAVAHELVSMTGIDFVELVEWPDVVIRKRPENLTYREAFGYVAGCCGKNARFNRLGQMEFVWYTDTGITLGRRVQYLNGMNKLNNKPLCVDFEVTGQQETYRVNVLTDGGGGLVATPGSGVLEGETVTLSVNPFSGHELALIEAVTPLGNDVPLYIEADGSGYSFVQPDSDVTVTASFRKSSEGPFKLTVRAYDHGGITHDGDEYFNEGETVNLYVTPDEGYKLDKFVTTPGSLSIVNNSFTMPKCDVTVTAYFKAKNEYYVVKRSAGDGGSIYIKNTSKEDIIEAVVGETVLVEFAPDENYILDYYDSTVKLMQVGTNTYTFVMPAEVVSINVYYKQVGEDNQPSGYSWLQEPQAPPTPKPYWAVFYNENQNAPTCQKYFLIWFEEWVDAEASDGKHSIDIFNYFYCGSKNTGHGNHEWDTSAWNGNGTTSLTWDARIDELYADWDAYYGPSNCYCLIASNVDLCRASNGRVTFEKNENYVTSPQTGYLLDGMDIREQGSLTQWLCPDSFSTPLPASNWMVLMPDSGLYMTPNAEGKYETPVSSYPKSLIALYYDDITIQNIGAIFPDTDEVMYVASFTNARWTYLRNSTLGWDDEVHELPEGAVIGLRNPLVTTAHASGYLDGSDYNFAGVLVTSETLYDNNGDVFMYDNACRICECSTSMMFSNFSLRKGATDADEITISYTNPMIYEKAVDAVSANVQSITYTPARVKHRGNPALQAGDIVCVPDGDGIYHTVLIMQQTMTFGGGMNGEITCPGQSNRASDFSANGPITTQIKKEVQAQNLELEHRVNANNSLVFASIYKSITSTEAKVKSVAEWQSANSATITEIKQTASNNKAKIELVVGQNGIVNEKGVVQGSIVIEAINGETKAKISADRLDIDGKELNIKVKATNITGVFTVTSEAGNEIFSAGEKTVRLGGWTVDNNSIRAGTLGLANSMWLCRDGTSTSATIGTSGDINGWSIAVADKFGVTKDGVLYGKDVNLSGEIEATKGKIGGWDIENDKLSGEYSSQKIEISPIGVSGYYTKSDGTKAPISVTWDAILTAAMRWNEV
ncbi:MAG: hypothetical protein J6S14_11145 [Clostridia bacterium]|nr:hypothetical protein [Clostridia bacterium]